MSDNLRRYRAIRQALTQGYLRDAQGNLVRHLNTLAALISGVDYAIDAIGAACTQEQILYAARPGVMGLKKGGTACLGGLGHPDRARPDYQQPEWDVARGMSGAEKTA